MSDAGCQVVEVVLVVSHQDGGARPRVRDSAVETVFSPFAWLVGRRQPTTNSPDVAASLRPRPVDVARDGAMAVFAMGVEALEAAWSLTTLLSVLGQGRLIRGFVSEHVTRCADGRVGRIHNPIVESVPAPL